MNKRIYKSNSNKMLLGVCGGIGEYLDIDPTLVRLVFVILTFIGCGSGIPIYILGAIIMPQAPTDTYYRKQEQQRSQEQQKPQEQEQPQEPTKNDQQ